MIDSLTSLGNKLKASIPNLKNIDHSAQRNYLEEGYLSNSFDSVSAKMHQVIMQQPEATVIFRKKMYTSLANNYVPRSMSDDERLYFAAMDRLFLNKCKQLKSYESLCKIEKASHKAGEIDEQLLPIIIGLSDTISSVSANWLNAGENAASPLGTFGDVIKQIKSVLNYSSSNFYTTWIEDMVTPYAFRFGYGTGAIEFSNFTRLSTNCTIRGSGSFNISFEDPYQLMTITPQDIETAISDVVNPNSLSMIQLSQESFDSLIDSNMQKLNTSRDFRNVSRIAFKINPNTIYGKKVIAIVEKTGQEIPFEALTVGIPGVDSVKVPEEYLFGGDILGEEGLSTKSINSVQLDWKRSSEFSIFQDLVNAIYNKINFNKNAIAPLDFARANENKRIDHVRRKLVFYFSGKNIIQPMDTVNIFISSKTKFDNKITSGIKNAFTGFGLFQNFSNQLTQTATSWNSLFSPNNIDNRMEKSVFGGENIPDYVWSMFRKNFTSEKEGCHVFAGIVNRVSSSYSDGASSVSVDGGDHTEYLTQSFINFKPGANTNAGIFYEPLTPYKSSFDSVFNLRKQDGSDFLDENLEILKTGALRIPDGTLAGRQVGDSGLPSEVVYTKTGNFTNGKRIIYAPDGLVYKWKEGIGTYSQSGSSDDIGAAENVGAFSAASAILANQDIMNAVSLMVTGTPYNYYTYYKAGTEVSSLVLNTQTKEDENPKLTTSALSKFIEKTIQNNAMWGDFIPFKGISLSKADVLEKVSLKSQKIISLQRDINDTYKKVDELVAKSTILGIGQSDSGAFYTDASAMESNFNQIASAREILSQKESDFSKLANDSSFSIIGDDIYEDYDFYFNNGSSYENAYSRKNLRKKSNFLTRRLSWMVRSNIDRNYFIVDESYDKNFDLIAFEADIAGQKQSLYNNDYTTVLDKVRAAVDLLGMEFFADTQGHLRVRAPQYNRMPSSVFLTMIKNKYTKKTGYVFPPFLTNLFLNQIDSLYKNLIVIENTIRYLCAILQKIDDDSALKYIRSSSGVRSANKKEFRFITMENGTIFGLQAEIDKIIKPKTEEDRQGRFSSLKVVGNQIKDQLNIQSTFDVTSRVDRVKKDLDEIVSNIKNPSTSQYVDSSTQNAQKIESLSQSIYQNGGPLLKLSDFAYYSSLGTTFGGVIFSTIYRPNYYLIDSKISENISNRQKVIKQLYYAIKNCYEFNSLSDDDTAIKLLNPSLIGPSEELPEVFENLIEDESYDDYGPGSGSRFVIKNSQLISYGISENNPEFTAVSVTGRLAKFFTANQITGDFSDLPSNGNSLISSSAVDYDLWRMYGLKQKFNIDKPFLTNAQSQTEPFAVSLLMNQRKNIIRGNASIIGNEYMQPGEVVYIEQKGMLFYIDSVSHSFSHGSDFTTTLNLSYGHYPGEYIPTQLDVAGKMLYTNRETYDVEIRRDIVTASGTPAGSLIMFDKSNIINNFYGNNDYAKNNLDSLQKIAKNLENEIIRESATGKKTILSLFIYEETATGNKNETAMFANEIKNILLGKSSYRVFDPKVFPKFEELANFTYKKDGQNLSTIRLVDLSDKESAHNPSSFAYFAAGSILDSKSNLIQTETNIKTLSNTPQGKIVAKNIYLTRYIVDCFIKSYIE